MIFFNHCNPQLRLELESKDKSQSTTRHHISSDCGVIKIRIITCCATTMRSFVTDCHKTKISGNLPKSKGRGETTH